MEICYKTFVVYSEDQANVCPVNSQETFVVYSEDQVNVILLTLNKHSQSTVKTQRTIILLIQHQYEI